MSYMRNPVYVYDDGENVVFYRVNIREVEVLEDPPTSIHAVDVPKAEFDAIALMHVAKLLADRHDDHFSDERLNAAVEVIHDNEGNFGSHTFLELMGEDPGARLREYLDAVKEKRDAEKHP